MKTMKTARPYRSHKYPACARCHKRRSRCTIEIPGQACLLCRMHGVPCSSATAKKDDRVTPRIGFVHRSLLTDEKSAENYSHIVGPVIARDTQILDQYLPQVNGHSHHVPIQPNIGRRESSKPIYHVPIPLADRVPPSAIARGTCLPNSWTRLSLSWTSYWPTTMIMPILVIL